MPSPMSYSYSVSRGLGGLSYSEDSMQKAISGPAIKLDFTSIDFVRATWRAGMVRELD